MVDGARLHRDGWSRLVLGGGAVGVEMAQAFRRLGCEHVTVVEVAPRLLLREEPFAGDEVRAALEAEGVTVTTGATIDRVHRAGTDGPVAMELTGGRVVAADEVLVAAGRGVRTESLGLDTVGLTSAVGLPEALVGATFTGPGIQELLHSVTVEIAGRVPRERLWHAVPSFPIIDELWLSLLESYGM